MPSFGALTWVALLATSLALPHQMPDPMIGAWGGVDSREGQDAEIVVIFTESHQVAVWFDAESGEVVHTNGGLWSRTGTHVTEVVEFDSDNPQRVGTSVSFDIELTDNELSIVGAPMQLTRIDGGDGNLQGAWEMFESSGAGQGGPGTSLIRLMSSTRFQQVAYEPETGRLIATSGGTYRLDGAGYAETVAFNTDGGTVGESTAARSIEHDDDVWRQTLADGTTRAWRRR